MTTTTKRVTGAEVQPGQVYKIRGRWLRVVRWLDEDWKGHSRYRAALVAQHNKDPRLANVMDGHIRLLWAGDEYATRDEPAPEWEWVTRKLARETA